MNIRICRWTFILLFSVNESKGWQGVAKMATAPADLPDKDAWLAQI